ncbi:transposase [Streptomyces sp. B4I13]|uniref:IS1634 family transposase n=1 Tax=Streptomyces sp. B4I13 TaxID=3042271 RepID=UPI002784160C|nr:IS1634 family transposase [Streptomyces sp. B4I13]MDQ0963432.1 transposase [Streptomyces sp. B4I13]
MAGIVDRLCPGRETAHVTHGQVIEVLVANRLTEPAPLWRVYDWAREWAVEEAFGIEPELLNDDRLGRALDAIAPHLQEITDSIGARAIGEFGIDVATMHWDMTSMSLHGAYPADGQDEDYPQVKYGHPKDRRFDLKQIQTGLAVSADGGIPVLSRVLDGGAAEVSQITGTMNNLRVMAGPKDFLLVGDSKLVSYGNVGALIAAGVDFVAPAPAAKVDDCVYAALDLDEATVVDYVPVRDENTPADKREIYRVLEDVHVLSGPRKRDPQLTVRRILVHSTGNARGQARPREKRLAKAREELEKLQRGAGGRYCNTAAKVAARIGVITKTRRVASCLRTEITADDAGRPALAWHFDEEVLRAEEQVDGWYALLTTLAPEQADPAEVLRRYKGQGAVERRYSDFKGPLAVTPIFVQDNKRLAALVTVICLALLFFCLIERQVRRPWDPSRRCTASTRATRPSGHPAIRPSGHPAIRPSGHPAIRPSGHPAIRPSGHPAIRPSGHPAIRPSGHPAIRPSGHPAIRPTGHPANRPSGQPAIRPTGHPAIRPTGHPAIRPTGQPANRPDDPLPHLRTPPAGQRRRRPTHRRRQPRRATPSARPPRTGTHPSPLARDLNE